MKKYKYRQSVVKASAASIKKEIFEALEKYEASRVEGVELNINSIIYHAIKVIKYSNTYSVRIYQNLPEGKPSTMVEVDNVFILKLILDSIPKEFIEVKD